MGGNITVEGVRGKGSCFSFTLFLKKEQSSQTTAKLISQSKLSSCRIIIFDRDEESRVTCQSVVKSVLSKQSSDVFIERVNQPNNKPTNLRERKIAVLGFDRTDVNVSATLARLQTLGWKIFVYSNSTGLSDLTKITANSSQDMFRRPLPLVRMGRALEEALMEEPHMHQKCSTVATSECDSNESNANDMI